MAEGSSPVSEVATGRPGWRLIGALGVTQIVSWGSLYYAFPLLLAPIEQELGWQRASVVGAFSLSLLIAGVAAIPAGMLIDRFGGRRLMAGGSLAAAALLALLGHSESLGMFYALWAGLGLCMAATLYEPAFAVIYRSFGADARKAVTALTSNGVMTIVRAVVPAALYGRERYATLNGALSVPVILSRAAGPVAASLLWSATGGYAGTLWGLVLASVLAVAAFWLAVRSRPSRIETEAL